MRRAAEALQIDRTRGQTGGACLRLRQSSLACPPVGSNEEMLALRDLFGYPFRGLFGAAHQPPAARAVAIANFRRSRHAADQAPTRDSKLSDALLRTKGLRPELRGDRGQLQLQLARDGARAPQQSRAEGIHQAEYNESRAIEILPSEIVPAGDRASALGAVAAGVPIEAIAHQETHRGPRFASCSEAAITTCCEFAATR